VYEAVPGRLPDIIKRFETKTLKIWEKHGIKQAGFFTTAVGEHSAHLTYFLAWESLADREKKWTAFMADRSIRMPPSHDPLPEELWPPQRTAVSSPFSRAKLTASMTSAVPRHRAMSAGFLSNMPFQICRAPS